MRDYRFCPAEYFQYKLFELITSLEGLRRSSIDTDALVIIYLGLL